MSDKVPVIGIPYISRPDLLSKLLVSLPEDLYERIHIIDNSPDGIQRSDIHEKTRVVITRAGWNLGVSASWNLVIKANPKAGWWALFNSDVVMDRTNLDLLIAAMKLHDIAYLNGMSAFGLRWSCIQKVGWFDVPAYCEDIDYDYRCRLMGVHIEPAGNGGLEHFGSAVLKSSAHYQAENGRSYPANRQYYADKWGGFVGAETYTTPFNGGGSPRDWTLDMQRLANLSWTWE
jgi:GT2 family glycosyltransferase